MIRKRSRFVRRGATGKGLLQDSTSPVAYSTECIRSKMCTFIFLTDLSSGHMEQSGERNSLHQTRQTRASLQNTLREAMRELYSWSSKDTLICSIGHPSAISAMPFRHFRHPSAILPPSFRHPSAIAYKKPDEYATIKALEILMRR